MWELWASEKNSKYNWTDYSNCRIEWKKKIRLSLWFQWVKKKYRIVDDSHYQNGALGRTKNWNNRKTWSQNCFRNQLHCYEISIFKV